MRVIAGRWRGRRLQAPPGDLVRPTTDRAKEALFNILGPRLVGCLVLDLCCGSGGLGLEALSRGASRVVFVDTARSSLEATRANLVQCGAERDSYRLECGEALVWLDRWTGPVGAPWILLCDPPYQSATAGAMMSTLTTRELPDRLVCAVVEHGPHTPGTTPLPAGWDTRRYGESHLAIFRPGAGASPQENRP